MELEVFGTFGFTKLYCIPLFWLAWVEGSYVSINVGGSQGDVGLLIAAYLDTVAHSIADGHVSPGQKQDDKMTAYITPTILTSKLFLGVVPSNQLGNVAWNDDGQCLFLTKRGATVMVHHT